MNKNIVSILEDLNSIKDIKQVYEKDYQIKQIPNTYGAYGVYDGNKLVVSADSRSEAEDELKELLTQDDIVHTYKVSYTYVDRRDNVSYKDITLKAHSEDELKSLPEYRKLYRDKMVHDMRISKLK